MPISICESCDGEWRARKERVVDLKMTMEDLGPRTPYSQRKQNPPRRKKKKKGKQEKRIRKRVLEGLKGMDEVVRGLEEEV